MHIPPYPPIPIASGSTSRKLNKNVATLIAIALTTTTTLPAAGPLGKGIHEHHGHEFNPLVPGYPNPDPGSQAEADLNAILANPYITHVQLSYHWRQLEPDFDDDYRWQIIHDDIAPFAAVGKKVWLEVVSASKRGTDIAPRGHPDWITLSPHKVPVVGKYHTSPDVDGDGEDEVRSRYPVYWHPKYQALWADFVEDFAAEFDGNEHVEFVSIGGHTAGTEPSLSAEDNEYYLNLVDPTITKKNWRQVGLDPGISDQRVIDGDFFNDLSGDPPANQVYLNVVKWAVDLYNTHFQFTPVAMVFKNRVDNDFDDAVANYSTTAGLGQGSNGLQNRVLPDFRTVLRDIQTTNGVFVGWFEFSGGADACATSLDIYKAGIGIEGDTTVVTECESGLQKTFDPWSRVSYVPATSVRGSETEPDWEAALAWAYGNLLDRIAPASVTWTGTPVTVNGAHITLAWNANTEFDLAGYNIYRSTDGGVNYTRIQELWPSTTFDDLGLAIGTYHYKVTAVDDGLTTSGAIGNESPDSTVQSGTTTVAPLTFRIASSATTVATSQTSLTIPRPSGVVAGDLLVASLMVNDTPLVNPAIPADWMEIVSATDNSGSKMGTKVYIRTVVANEPTSYTWNFTAGPNPFATRAAGGILAFFNENATTPIQISAVDKQGSIPSAERTTPTIATTAPAVLVAIFGEVSTAGSTWTGPAGMTERVDVKSTHSSAIDASIAIYTENSFVPAGSYARTAMATVSSTEGLHIILAVQ